MASRGRWAKGEWPEHQKFSREYKRPILSQNQRKKRNRQANKWARDYEDDRTGQPRRSEAKSKKSAEVEPSITDEERNRAFDSDSDAHNSIMFYGPYREDRRNDEEIESELARRKDKRDQERAKQANPRFSESPGSDE